jgi:ribosomal protein S20
VEEVIEAVSRSRDYDGIAIADAAESTLKPAFEQLEAAIEVGDQDKISAAYDEPARSAATAATRAPSALHRHRAQPRQSLPAGLLAQP